MPWRSDPSQATARLAKPRGIDGFTLIELLVVVAILAAIMTIVPHALAGLPSIRLRAAAAELTDLLRQVHEDAVRTDRTIEVEVDAPHRRLWISGHPDVMLPPIVDDLSISLDGPAPTSASGRIRFFPDGSATGGTVIIRHQDRTATIAIAWLSGRIQNGD